MEPLRSAPGSLLAAAPDLLDPNFMHAVVLMVTHEEQGAMGLIVNRPSGVTVDVLLPDHPVLSTQRFPVHQGGPVGRDTLQFVHRVPKKIPGGIEIAGGLWLGGELDALAQYLAKKPKEARERVKLLVGYAGWGEDQLEGELAGGSWLPAAPRAEWIFDPDPQHVWRHVVRSLGDEAEGLEDLPPDVSWN
ncbi:MAG: YqgE/AlgH family protein [Planctomycetes bacterium]|nr:YqgE/AlgH family protein [Planctomycetota bacterium]